MVNIIVNGRPCRVKEGTLLLKACEDNGFPIPHLCYKEGLSSTGACRLCLVKVEGERKLVASCSVPVREGMKIVTDDEQLRDQRRMNLELLLSEREHNCLTCEKSGQCELQDLAYALDVKTSRFPVDKTRRPVEDSSEVIVRDANRCILCGRCVRACSEIAGRNILGFAQRGANLVINAGIDDPRAATACVSCGACLQACPTGAITEKLARLQARAWELDRVRTTCTHCGGGCQIELGTKDGKIVRVRGVEGDTAENNGHLCVKGRFGMDFVQSSERLQRPLVKKDGVFEEVGWDEALDLVAERFTRIREQHGSDAIGGIASAKTTNEDDFVFQKFLRACVGTNNVDFCTRFCHTPSAVALSRAFGGGAMTNSTELYRQADVLLVAGLNLTDMYPVFADYVKRAVRQGRMKLIVVDPRRIDLVDDAQVWIRPQLGSDLAWINGLMQVILAEDLHDADFIARRTAGFEELARVVAGYEPRKVRGPPSCTAWVSPSTCRAPTWSPGCATWLC
jgi:predicted molibdopterin-dependent oxidoreductase YjgC